MITPLDTSDVEQWISSCKDALILHPVPITNVPAFQYEHYPVTQWVQRLDTRQMRTRLTHWNVSSFHTAREYEMSGPRGMGHVMLSSLAHHGELRFDYCNFAHICCINPDRSIDMTAVAIASQRLYHHCVQLDPDGAELSIVIPDLTKWTTGDMSHAQQSRLSSMLTNIVPFTQTWLVPSLEGGDEDIT